MLCNQERLTGPPAEECCFSWAVPPAREQQQIQGGSAEGQVFSFKDEIMKTKKQCVLCGENPNKTALQKCLFCELCLHHVGMRRKQGLQAEEAGMRGTAADVRPKGVHFAH